MDNQSRILRKSNNIINISNGLNLLEHKAYNEILFGQQEQKSLELNLSVSSFIPVVGKDNYTKTVQILDGLRLKRFKFIDDKMNKHIGVCGHINEYEVSNGQVRIMLSSKLFELMDLEAANNLLAGYSNIDLSVTHLLECKYGCYLYEYIAMLKGKKDYADKRNKINPKSRPINITIDKGREITNSTNKYGVFSKWKEKIISPAIEDINKHAKFTMEVDFLIENKKVTSFNIFRRKKLVSGQSEQQKPTPVVAKVLPAEPVQPVSTIEHLPEPVRELIKAGFKDEDFLLNKWHKSDEDKREIAKVWDCVSNSYIKQNKPFGHGLIKSFFDKKTFADEQKPSLAYADDRDAKPRCTLEKQTDEDKQIDKEIAELNNERFGKVWNAEQDKLELLKDIQRHTLLKSVRQAISELKTFDWHTLISNKQLRGEVLSVLSKKYNLDIVRRENATEYYTDPRILQRIKDTQALTNLFGGVQLRGVA